MKDSYPGVDCEGVHIDRAAGGHCNHRHAGGPASFCSPAGTRSRSSHTVQKLSQPDWNIASQPPRHLCSVSTRYSASSPESDYWANPREPRITWLDSADTFTTGTDQSCASMSVSIRTLHQALIAANVRIDQMLGMKDDGQIVGEF